MLIIPYVCAEFTDRAGNVLYRITPDMLHTLQEAPEAIRQDLLYGMLVKDGSIKTPETVTQKKQLELDPMDGIAADGKENKETSAGAEDIADKSAKTGKKGGTPETKSGK